MKNKVLLIIMSGIISNLYAVNFAGEYKCAWSDVPTQTILSKIITEPNRSQPQQDQYVYRTTAYYPNHSIAATGSLISKGNYAAHTWGHYAKQHGVSIYSVIKPKTNKDNTLKTGQQVMLNTYDISINKDLSGVCTKL